MSQRIRPQLVPPLLFWSMQAIFAGALGLSFAAAWASPVEHTRMFPNKTETVVPVPRKQPLRIMPLYNDPKLVSDEDLGAVLAKVRPRFDQTKLRPNFVEHALRIWSVDAEFGDPKVMSGQQMKEFLIDHGKYLASWGSEIKPLLLDQPGGVAIRWGLEECASVHHDHWLACLTEAGVSLDQPVFTPARHMHTINDVIQQSLRDFRLDERETEWSTMAFGLWIAPTKAWTNGEGRQISFDQIAERLIRGHKRLGVCNGLHRVYSLVVLIRLDNDHKILSAGVREKIFDHLRGVRRNIMESQFEDGHWPTNWMDGAEAISKPVDDPLFRKVIATGHHLEWMAIAPPELHVPREQLEKAAKWVIATTKAQTTEGIQQHYTFYSHVGGALSLWRNTRAADFWKDWERKHPEVNIPEPKSEQAQATDGKATPAAKADAAAH